MRTQPEYRDKKVNVVKKKHIIEKRHAQCHTNVRLAYRFSLAPKIDGKGGLELGLCRDHPNVGVCHHGGLAEAPGPEAGRLVGLVILQLEQQVLFS